MPDGDELNPQKGISTEVLAERLTNYFQNIQTEFSALHHHLSELITRIDGQANRSEVWEGKVRDLENERPRINDKLLEFSSKFTNMETKFGQIDTKLKEIDDASLVATALREQKAADLAKQDKVRLIVFSVIPICLTTISILITIYVVFFS